MPSHNQVDAQNSESSNPTTQASKPHTGREILEHFGFGLLLGLAGVGIVALGTMISPVDSLELSTLIVWATCLPLATGLFAAVLGEWGVTLMADIMTFMG